MTDAQGADERFFGAPLEIVIYDGTLSLGEVEELAGDYPWQTGNPLKIESRWGGPAASGPPWGGPEIAVAIIAGELLRRITSDGYGRLKDFMLRAYKKIRTRNGARIYTEGAMALAVYSKTKALRVFSALPRA